MAAQVLTPTRPDEQTVSSSRWYEYQDTRGLVELVNEAADLVRTKGSAAFADFRVPGSQWRRDDLYVFVLDLDGTMLVHPDPAMEGKNEIDLKDVNGKSIVRGLIGAATATPGKPDGWYHYQWPAPGALLPRWRSSYVQLVTPRKGPSCVIGCGLYDDRMERGFVIDAVANAVALLATDGEDAFPLFRDPKGPFIAKDAYIFVIDMNGVELVNGAFPTLEGHNLLDWKDTDGKHPIREMVEVARTSYTGWVDYMWPKPGESVATRKSAYVSRARVGGRPVVVGCGVYLADAPRSTRAAATMTAPELMTLVRDAAILFEKQGDEAFAEFRRSGSKWLHDDIYLFAWVLDGTCVFHGADPGEVGRNARDLTDALGRPIGRMVLDISSAPSGEGWIHYMYPQPGNIFPTWKSAFVRRATSPSGRTCVLGSGIYNMQMDEAFIEDVVQRAAASIAERGPAAFDQLRDRRGPFVFMDTYVFVQRPDGTELVNPAFPSLEGRNLIDLRDLKGNPVIRDEIAAALERGRAWIDLYWFTPGTNTPALKRTYVQKVDSGGETYIVGSGLYVEGDA